MKKPKKYQAGGVAGGKGPKAPDKQGAWIDVQKRTLNQKAKNGASLPKKSNRGT